MIDLKVKCMDRAVKWLLWTVNMVVLAHNGKSSTLLMRNNEAVYSYSATKAVTRSLGVFETMTDRFKPIFVDGLETLFLEGL